MSRPAVFMRMPEAFSIRPAEAEDIDALNGVIERAISTWNLPERVKRLSLPSYRYQAHDFNHLHIVVAEDEARAIIGVAAWEAANPRDVPAGRRGLLLHGVYADPAQQHRGVGGRLLDAALRAACDGSFDGLLVKAQADANGFFAGRGMARLPVENPERDYPNRYWQACPVHC